MRRWARHRRGGRRGHRLGRPAVARGRQLRTLFVTPIRPGLVGSGLAHRAAAWMRALGALGEVRSLVVPVADPGARADTSLADVVMLPDDAERQIGAVRGMAQPPVRALMAAFDVDVPAAVAAPPWLGVDDARRRFAGETAFDLVVCFRSYLVPFVAGLRSGAPAVAGARLVVDLDDDDAAFHRHGGRSALADAHERLLAAMRRELDVLCVAAGHHTLAGVRLLPNCVDVLRTVAAPPSDGPVLFVGNLTYAPNADGLDWYLRSVHPILAATAPWSLVRVVGPGGGRWSTVPGVEVAGTVADLAPEYAAASVVVAPIRTGSGTRIKVLEAWAHGRPVVATSAAMAGLAFEEGVHALVADEPAAFAASIDALRRDPQRASVLAAAGRAHVAHHYSSAVFDRSVARIVGLG